MAPLIKSGDNARLVKYQVLMMLCLFLFGTKGQAQQNQLRHQPSEGTERSIEEIEKTADQLKSGRDCPGSLLPGGDL